MCARLTVDMEMLRLRICNGSQIAGLVDSEENAKDLKFRDILGESGKVIQRGCLLADVNLKRRKD